MKIDRPNSIVLVTVDCLRADHVGFIGYSRPTTPFLDELAKESFVIPSAIVAGAPTYYSFPAILGSRYPLALGRDALGLAPCEPSLASELQRAGYATAGFVAANPYVSSQFGYERGFDNFEDFLQELPNSAATTESPSLDSLSTVPNNWMSRLNQKLQNMRPAMGPLRPVYDEIYFRYCQRVTPVPESLDALRKFPSADQIVEHATTWLESIGEKPFFLWLHLMDPHSPYYPKEEALDSMGESRLTPYEARYLNSYWNRSDLGPRRMATHRHEVMALYDAGVRWVDAQLQRLIALLKKENRWKDCVFAFTGDHGEEFLEHGGRYHPPNNLMEELIHVPLLLRVPGAVKREVSQAPFSLLHLAPTLLDIAEVPKQDHFEGQSQWPALQNGGQFSGPAISECIAGCTNPFHPENRRGPRVLSVRESRFKLILCFDPPAERFYDLEADPGEHSPLAPSEHKAERRRLLEIAREHVRVSLAERDQKARAQVQLRELQLQWKNSADKVLSIGS